MLKHDHADNHNHDGDNHHCAVVGFHVEGAFAEERAEQDVVHQPHAAQQEAPPNGHVDVGVVNLVFVSFCFMSDNYTLC